MHITLPDDQWADLFDPVKVPERKRRPVMRALAGFMQERGLRDDQADEAVKALTPELLAATDELNDSVIVALVKAWSYGDVVSVDAVQDLPSDAYRELGRVCGEQLNALLPSFAGSTDPKVTT